MKVNKIISVRTISGNSLSGLLSGLGQFNVQHVVKCGGVWCVSYA